MTATITHVVPQSGGSFNIRVTFADKDRSFEEERELHCHAGMTKAGVENLLRTEAATIVNGLDTAAELAGYVGAVYTYDEHTKALVAEAAATAKD